MRQNITIQTGVNILGSESYGKQIRKKKIIVAQRIIRKMNQKKIEKIKIIFFY